MKTLSTAIWIELITARLLQISPAVLAMLFIRIINTCLEAAKENNTFYISSLTVYRAQKRASLKVHQRKFAVFAV
ncbi:hypothetical protein [Pedobacter duraquae]|uniref:hypothetical protein n=1 Tax=Pedobacter duraquae TaxID=425511 RepID=UPI00105FA6BA|nr:hypothetical protein [Pedobacter duraquae]